MKVIIHKGKTKSSGCLTEILSCGKRIFIDFGRAIPFDDLQEEPPQIKGLTVGEPDCDGIFFTNCNSDHIGMYKKLSPDIPIFMGETSKKLLLLKESTEGGVDLEKDERSAETINTFEEEKPINMCGLSVTPIFTDHSAYDSYIFLISGEGKNILHFGDAHNYGYDCGYSRLVEAFSPDLIIYDGTKVVKKCDNTDIFNEDTGHGYYYESHLSFVLKKYYAERYKYIFVICSPFDTDRMQTLYRECRISGKHFLCDSYQKEILNIILSRESSAMRNPYNDFWTIIGEEPPEDYIEADLSEAKEKGFFMPVRPEEKFSEFMKKFNKEETIVLYSIEDEFFENYKAFLDGFNFKRFHGSVHAVFGEHRSILERFGSRRDILERFGSRRRDTKALPLHADTSFFEDTAKSNQMIQAEDGKEIDLTTAADKAREYVINAKRPVPYEELEEIFHDPKICFKLGQEFFRTNTGVFHISAFDMTGAELDDMERIIRTLLNDEDEYPIETEAVIQTAGTIYPHLIEKNHFITNSCWSVYLQNFLGDNFRFEGDLIYHKDYYIH